MSRKSGTWYVTLYETNECYGGPEEGGWYFESGLPVRHIRVRGLDAAERLAKALTDSSDRQMVNPSFDHEISGPNDSDGSEIYEAKLQARVSRQRGNAYPTHTPHYE